ncbi:MAG: hypothetical protein E6I57_11995 [Chloroflexi bacterium]|nr:MAG: hypothetical protein E6J38_10955 [Chloroflexota bacterium]TMC28397.1 MAG: hypothetical protein E6J27_08810 [Chloroflexota bacterium]TMC37380.1 MAG: hypothetical protein E6J24_00635 [Chloroflexota bacterium]TME37246.1 MAG: hypothetical protein E6I57_11995 [Chloroflexota bacterium]
MLRIAVAFAFAVGLTFSFGASAALATACPSTTQTFPVAIALPNGTTTIATVVLGPETGSLETTCSGAFTVRLTRYGFSYTIGAGTFTATHNNGVQATFTGALFGVVPFSGTLNYDATTMAGVAVVTFPTLRVTVTTTFANAGGSFVVTGVQLTRIAAPVLAGGGDD